MTRLLLALLSFWLVACDAEKKITDSPGTDGATTGTDGTDGTNASDGADGTESADGTGCVARCDGRQCGADGCGGFCGTCSPGTACTPAGACQAPPGCKPLCEGKSCGPNGCGGTCGVCPAGKACNGAGQCTDGGGSGCLPACEGKLCGDDGCGGFCGKCAAGQDCTDGQCTGETSQCGTVDEVGECQQQGEIAVTCKAGKLLAVVCDPNKGYVCGFNEAKAKYDCIKSGCKPDCQSKTCGPDGCGGQCGQCAPDQTCNANGLCEVGGACTPKCAQKTCGPDGCGGKCGICDAGQACEQGSCVTTGDCTPSCNTASCGPDGCGGSCGTCKPGESCTSGQCKSTSCTASCVGRDCGNDGCGGSCGTCAASQKCDASGHCVIPGGGECGDLTFEGRCAGNGKIVEWCESGKAKQQDCGALGASLVCAWIPSQETYWCVDSCVAACASRECGPKGDGCTGDCGTCPEGETCNADGLCVAVGGGGSCGTVTVVGECQGQTLAFCASGEIVTTNCGQFGLSCGWDPVYSWFGCVDPSGCVPNCVLDNDTPRECGDDGCGNLCGYCAAGEGCVDGKCTAGADSCGGLDEIGECVGDTLRYCVGGNIQEVQCAGSGLKCAFDATANGGQGWFDCVGGAASCDSATYTPVCTASEVLLSCEGGAVIETPCAGASPECLQKSGEYACAAKPAGCGTCSADTRCQADGTCGCDGIDVLGQCENNVLVYCLDEALVTQDCSATSSVCDATDGFFVCVGP